jgi:hypothetical protein
MVRCATFPRAEDEPMTEDQERLFKSLNTLRQAAWDSFDHRRTYEWKFAFGVWTPLVVLTGTLLTHTASESYPLRGPWAVGMTGLFGLMVIGLHAYWSRGINRANDIDRALSYAYEENMCPLVSVSRQKLISPIIERFHGREKRTQSINFSHLAQVATTVLLVLAAICAVWARTHSPDPPEVVPQKTATSSHICLSSTGNSDSWVLPRRQPL